MSWSGSFNYSWNPPQPTGRLSTSRTELLNVTVAFVVLTFDIYLLFAGRTLFAFASGGFGPTTFGLSLQLLGVAAAAALTGFVAHEMAHKVAAQRRGFWAEFRASAYGLILSVITASIGFLFAAPGATLVGGIPPYDARSWGRTSLAGPMTNVAFAGAFYAGWLAAFAFRPALAGSLAILAFVNAWFGAFNLLPFGPLDGRKVYRWDRTVWAIALVGTLAAAGICITALTLGTPFL